MPEARIFQRIKSSMQSGKKRVGQWVIEFEHSEPRHADPLTGWAGSGDTMAQLSLGFATLEAAKAYCDAQGYTYHVIQGSPLKLKLQAYADNFK